MSQHTLRALTLIVSLQATAYTAFVRATSPRGHRGSATTEYILWAVAVIGIVGIARAAVKLYVKTQSGHVK